MHKAFWDCLETQLNDAPPVYEHAIKLVGEIKEVSVSKPTWTLPESAFCLVFKQKI